MSFKSRVLIFITFFISCLAIGFLLAGLTTDYWITATLKRHNTTTESKGYLNFGLFSGKKELSSGYGSRIYLIDVISFIRNEPDSMNIWLWLGTALGTGFALFSSAVAAIASVLRAASSKNHSYMVLLFVANISSAISQILAFLCWLTQFYLHLTHNVLEAEERKINWNNHQLADLGFSFYFIIISTIFVFINIGILGIVYKVEKNEKRRLRPQYEDKAQSAIMLY